MNVISPFKAVYAVNEERMNELYHVAAAVATYQPKLYLPLPCHGSIG